VNRTPGVLPEPAATISFENFDAGSIRAIVRYWLEPARTDPGEAQNAVVSAITEAARVENIAIPLPIQMPQVHPPDSSNGTAGTAGAAGAAHPALAGTPPATK
jgi:small-conductance mechanosensitive channel